jgi:glutathione-regulated potassium-efflux system ancillary protein KefG
MSESKKLLILFAHPRFEKSRANKKLVNSIPKHPSITFHDLYEHYPNFNIDLEREKDLLLSHDVIIWQHPFYWYSAPPLLKQWIDMVLEFGWAYGPGGRALEGKIIFNALTSGGTREVYSKEGRNRFTIREFLAPFDQTAVLCKMKYLPPFAVQGTHRLSDEELNRLGLMYEKLIEILISGEFEVANLIEYEFLNDYLAGQLL